MITTTCEWEQAVLGAVASETWTDQLRTHLTTCPACADAALVARALREIAASTPDNPLPDPGQIWRAAARSERRQAAERVTWPITVMTWLALATGAVAAVAGAVWKWPAIQGQLAAVGRSLLAPAPPTMAELPVAVVAVASFAVFIAAFRLFESWASE
jgi:hypothetical protein